MNNNFKIESMVELRAFAITKTIEYSLSKINENLSINSLIDKASKIAEYIKGNAELPEVVISPDGVLYDYITKMIEENKKADKMIDEIFKNSNIDPKFLKKDNNS